MSEAALKTENPFIYRSYKQEDLNFIQSSWGHSYYSGAGYKQFLAPEEFHYHHRPIREKILKSPNVAIIVCAAEFDPETILGWICVEQPRKTNAMILHYIYVKAAFKHEGIAKELIKRAINRDLVFMTHMTEKAARIIRKRPATYENYYMIPHLI